MKRVVSFPILGISLIVLSGFFYSCNGKTKRVAKKRGRSLKKISIMMENGQYQDALDTLTRLKKYYKKDARYWNLLGMALRVNSFLDHDEELRKEEIKAFRRAIKIDSEFLTARVNLATTLWETDKKDEAITLYKTLLDSSVEKKIKIEIRNRLKQHELGIKLRTEKKKKSLLLKNVPILSSGDKNSKLNKTQKQDVSIMKTEKSAKIMNKTVKTNQVSMKKNSNKH